MESELGFKVVKRGNTYVLVYTENGCHPATAEEYALWVRLYGEPVEE